MNRLESIKTRFSKYEFVHSYIDDNCCNQEWDEAHEAVEYLLQRLERYESVLLDISSNYDCDSDAHKYGTNCRKCEAQEALKDEAIQP